MSKYIFIILALFGLNALANVEPETSAEPSMMDSADMKYDKKMSEEGLMGAFSLRYKPMGFEEDADQLTYRARVGWKGAVNDAVNWGVSVSTEFENNFKTGLDDLSLDQAYVIYNPAKGFYIKAGKMGWIPSFHKVGVFMSEQLYLSGLGIKYKHELENDGKAYVKLAAYNNTKKDTDEDGNEVSDEDVLVMGKVGIQYNTSDIETGVFVGGIYDNGLFVAEGEDSQTLAQAGLNIGSSSMLPVSVGLFGLAVTDVSDLGGALSYNAGIYVGNAGKPDSAEMGDFGLAVSYYDINPAGLITEWLNEDYVNGDEENGIATRAQYNPWDNVSLAIKLAYALGKEADNTNLVGELMFVF